MLQHSSHKSPEFSLAIKPQFSMVIARLIILIFSLFVGIIFVFDVSFASQESGILHPDGVQDNATYEVGPPTRIQFQIADGLDIGDIIEITFPTDFGTVSDALLVVRQDNDDTPCDGAVVTETSDVESNRIVSITLASAINAGQSVCIENLLMATSNPSETVSIAIQTLSGNTSQTIDFGAAIHDGDPSGTATAVSATVGVFIDLLIQGTEIGFSELDEGTNEETGSGYGFGGSTVTVSTNAPLGVSIQIQQMQPLENSNGDVFPDYDGTDGLGLSAETTSPNVTVTGAFSKAIGNRSAVPQGAPTEIARSAVPLNGADLDLSYFLGMPTGLNQGSYGTIFTITVLPNV